MPVRGPFARFLAGVALVLLAAVAVIGGVALRGPGLVAVLVSGAMAGCIAAGVARETPAPRRRSITESALHTAAVTVAVLLVLSGAALLLGGGFAVLLVGMAGAGWAVTRWLRRRQVEAGRPARVQDFGHPVVLGMPVAAGLPTSELADEWVRTGVALRGSLEPATRQGLVVRRSQLLDELERRDPDGFARWLAAGPLDSADPTGFVRGGPRRSGPSSETKAA
ncbi:hypothetical protein [Blastococcus saxobsidens]|uniref:Uncharacterized protein n=1 Tax=Blastococcus saxobsidens TaxID=138336 RepID=A0A4Q7YAV0_9ACTN|nr:hypothetical protein [Blastococcus saxobsidens]RZU34332.1 hypothetical protein BKA19_4095 [Blastococcus saxobsidens]